MIRKKSILRNVFAEHPSNIGETYTQHMRIALGYGLRLCIAGLACVVHAIIPFLFQETASSTIKALHNEFLHRAQKNNHNNLAKRIDDRS